MSGENNPTDDDSGARTVRLSDEGCRFAQRCAVLTGFEPYDLLATGMADLYLATARDQVGATVLDAVLSVVERDPDALRGTELEVVGLPVGAAAVRLLPRRRNRIELREPAEL